jgi:hypothetical protein
MKNLNLVGMVVLSLVAITAKAETKVYSPDAVEILNVVSECPSEFQVLAKQGYVTHATHESAEDSDSYVIYFSAGGRVLGPPAYPVGTLTVSRTYMPSPVPTPADYGGHSVVTCAVKTVR